MRKLLLLLAGLVLSACGRGGGPAPVTEVGDRTISPGEFQRYLLRETGQPVEQIDKAAQAQLREELLAEVLLSREAERKGLTLAPEAVAEEVALLQSLGSGAAPQELEREARRSLLARLYEQTDLIPEVVLDPREVDRLAAAIAGRRGSEEVIFRQILAESANAARQARERVLKGEGFEAVAGEVSGNPRHGRRQRRQLSLLPPAAARILGRLKPGELSEPVEIEGGYYLFLLENRRSGAALPEDRDRAEAEEELFRQNFTRLRRARLAQLADGENVRPPAELQPGVEVDR